MKDGIVKLIKHGTVYKNGSLIDAENVNPEEMKDAYKKTMAFRIMQSHNKSDDENRLKLKFDALTSHDITYVGIIQTARASGLKEFPMPYVLTNCHNSLSAVGGTINEDDHVFGLSCAKKYGGIYVPPHLAVIHQYAREMLSGCNKMILGSDSHTRYGALGTMAIGEGGPELVKQLLNQTYDIGRPEVVAVYLHGSCPKGVGPHDIAIALVGATFESGFVKNKILEFVGPGIEKLSVDFRIGVDVMTTETTCLSSVWETDDKVKDYYNLHNRAEEYCRMKPLEGAFYDAAIDIDLSKAESMIALPFHPSNAFTIHELYENLEDILRETEKKAQISFGDRVDFRLTDKIRNKKLYVEQGVIAGCAGGGFENLCAAADILNGQSIGNDEFSLSVYPASQPVYLELMRNGKLELLAEAGATIRTAFCGPCFGAGDVPANKGLSIRHSTRNFPNREGSKVQNGQIASVALVDARSIAATAANGGALTAATDCEASYTNPGYRFDGKIYEKRVYNGWKNPVPETLIRRGPNIVDWPEQRPLTDNVLLKIVSEIHDPVTTTDELIPSGETSSYRSNPLGLAEYTLSRKDPDYVKNAKEVKRIEDERRIKTENTGDLSCAEADSSNESRLFGAPSEKALKEYRIAMDILIKENNNISYANTCLGSAVFAIKPGDGSAREQAASCQRVLGGIANIAGEYATKRYRSNLINWGMLPLLTDIKDLPFKKGDYILLPGIRGIIESGKTCIQALRVNSEEKKTEAFTLRWDPLTQDEREIVLKGCLINFNKK